MWEKRDLKINTDILHCSTRTSNFKSYFDANAHVGYKYNSQLTGRLELTILLIKGIKMVKLSRTSFSNCP
jgi:hypothetical protein